MMSVSDAVLSGAGDRVLAQAILSDYYEEKQISYPINPFQMLTDYGVPFAFRTFSDKKIEGVYFPAQDANDTPVVGINIKRPITRQRYTAAHELCHHIKDTKSSYVCTASSNDSIEKYAENFAAELLMPYNEIKRQISQYECNGTVSFDSVLLIAEYFGVSFKSCLNRIGYTFKKIDGEYSNLQARANKYHADKKREAMGYTHCMLYEQLINAVEPWISYTPNDFIKAKFCNNYIFNDSRLEGVDLEKTKVAEIVTDIRLHGRNSHYCTEKYENEIAVAGHALMYEYMFEISKDVVVDIFSLVKLHKQLYSCAPSPDFGGSLRNSDPLVLGAKFETIPYSYVASEFCDLNGAVKDIIDAIEKDPLSYYIKLVTKLHHCLTVLHPFGDGNGRSSRAFLNLLLIRRGIFPIYIKVEEKNEYYDALSEADSGQYDKLYMVIYKAIMRSQTELTEASPL